MKKIKWNIEIVELLLFKSIRHHMLMFGNKKKTHNNNINWKSM